MLSPETLAHLKEFRTLKFDYQEKKFDEMTYRAKLVQLYAKVDPVNHNSWLQYYKDKCCDAIGYELNCINEIRVLMAKYEDMIIEEALA